MSAREPICTYRKLDLYLGARRNRCVALRLQISGDSAVCSFAPGWSGGIGSPHACRARN